MPNIMYTEDIQRPNRRSGYIDADDTQSPQLNILIKGSRKRVRSTRAAPSVQSSVQAIAYRLLGSARRSGTLNFRDFYRICNLVGVSLFFTVKIKGMYPRASPIPARSARRYAPRGGVCIFCRCRKVAPGIKHIVRSKSYALRI